MVLQSHLNLENCMTVRTGYVPQRSNRHDRESVSVPTGTKRRERSSGQERRSERAAKSNVKIKTSENGEIVFCSVRLSAWNRVLSNSERRLPFGMIFRHLHAKTHQAAKAEGAVCDQHIIGGSFSEKPYLKNQRPMANGCHDLTNPFYHRAHRKNRRKV